MRERERGREKERESYTYLYQGVRPCGRFLCGGPAACSDLRVVGGRAEYKRQQVWHAL